MALVGRQGTATRHLGPYLGRQLGVGAPDLVIEVLSESTEKRDRTTKLKLYARFGVLEYWIINPYGPSADVYRRGESGLSLAATLAPEEALTSPLLPGFSAPLHRLIA